MGNVVFCRRQLHRDSQCPLHGTPIWPSHLHAWYRGRPRGGREGCGRLVGDMFGLVRSWLGRKSIIVSEPPVNVDGSCQRRGESRVDEGVRHNDIISHVAEIQTRLLVFGSRSGDNLPQEGGHDRVSGREHGPQGAGVEDVKLRSKVGFVARMCLSFYCKPSSARVVKGAAFAQSTEGRRSVLVFVTILINVPATIWRRCPDFAEGCTDSR